MPLLHPRLPAPQLLAVGHGLQAGEFDEAGADDHGWRVGLIGKLGTGSGLPQVSTGTGKEGLRHAPPRWDAVKAARSARARPVS